MRERERERGREREKRGAESLRLVGKRFRDAKPEIRMWACAHVCATLSGGRGRRVGRFSECNLHTVGKRR